MFLRLFNRYQWSSFLLLLIYAIILRLPLFIFPVQDLNSASYSWISFFGLFPTQNIFFTVGPAVFLTILLSFQINWMAIKCQVVDKPSYIVAFWAVTFFSFSVNVFCVNSSLVACALMLNGLFFLFHICHIKVPPSRFFHAGLLLSLAIFIDVHNVFFLLGAIFFIFWMKGANIKYVGAFVIGSVSMFYFTGVYAYWTDTLPMWIEPFQVMSFQALFFKHIVTSPMYILTLIMLVLGGFSVQNKIRFLDNKARHMYLLAVCVVICTFLVLIFTPFTHTCAFVYMAFPLSIFVTNFLKGIERIYFAEIITLFLCFIVLLFQYVNFVQ